ncbi:MAG: DsbA family protein [Pseudomonadota bacterium]
MLSRRDIACRARAGAVVASLTLGVAACTPGADPLSSNLQSSSSSTNAATASVFSRDAVPASAGPTRVVIKNPTLAQLKQTGPLEERAMGDPNARVTVIEYGSWTCPHCRAFREKTWPTFKREYIDTGKVHYILREFPIGRSSGNAALITRCAPKGDYFRLYDLYLKNQGSWVSQDVRTDKIYAVAAKAGMSRATFDACLKDEKLIAGITWQKNRGRELGVIGTPTFFINTTHVRSFQSIEDMRRLIDPQLSGQTASAQ